MERYSYKDIETIATGRFNDPEYRRLGEKFERSVVCSYCGENLDNWKSRDKVWDEEGSLIGSEPEFDEYSHLKVCRTCGWWATGSLHLGFGAGFISVAVLKKLDIGSVDPALLELRRLLTKDWRYAKHLSAQRAEDLVASVLKEHFDCEVLYLTDSVYAPDGGVDFVVIKKSTGEMIAVQVKRRQSDRAEPISEVRAFLGAVALSPFDAGIYVTTAKRYAKGVQEALTESYESLRRRRLHVELVDAKQLRAWCRLDAMDERSLDELKRAVGEYSRNWWLNPSCDVRQLSVSGGVTLDDVLRESFRT